MVSKTSAASTIRDHFNSDIGEACGLAPAEAPARPLCRPGKMAPHACCRSTPSRCPRLPVLGRGVAAGRRGAGRGAAAVQHGSGRALCRRRPRATRRRRWRPVERRSRATTSSPPSPRGWPTGASCAWSTPGARTRACRSWRCTSRAAAAGRSRSCSGSSTATSRPAARPCWPCPWPWPTAAAPWPPCWTRSTSSSCRAPIPTALSWRGARMPSAWTSIATTCCWPRRRRARSPGWRRRWRRCWSSMRTSTWRCRATCMRSGPSPATTCCCSTRRRPTSTRRWSAPARPGSGRRCCRRWPAKA